MFYPKWWLDLTGYFLNHPNTGPDTIMFASQPSSITGSFLFFSVLATACLSMFVGMQVERKKVTLLGGGSLLGSSKHSYEMIATETDDHLNLNQHASTSGSSSRAYTLPSIVASKRGGGEGYNSIA